MKRHFLPAVFCLISCFHGIAQKPADFGEVTMAEMNMTTYAKDTAASAVILFDRGSCTLTEAGEVTYKRHMRIKFFSNEAIDEYATRKLLLYRDEEKVSRIRGAAYNLEGGKIVQSKLTDENIFKTKQAKIYDEYSFTIPNARPGSVIEYSYIISYNLARLPSWDFQHSIPTMLSEYELDYPAIITIQKQMQGFLSISDVKNSSNGREKWTMRDAPAFKTEPYTTNPADFLSNIKFYITEVFIPGQKVYDFRRTWEQIAKGLNDHAEFGGQVKASGYLNKTVEPLIAGVTAPEEKMKKIYDFVKTNVSWDQTVDLWPDRPFRKLLDEKKGTAAEINLLMVSMMQKADLESYPVVLSTRDNGRLWPFYPQVGQFNTVLCMVKIGDKKILLDGTDPTLPYTALPERYLNGEGLVIKPAGEIVTGAEWVPLVSTKARTVYNFDLTLDDSGELKGKMSISRDGLHSGTMRKEIASLGKEKYIEKTLSNHQWEVTTSEFKNIDVPTGLASENYELLVRDHVQAAGDVMYLSPYLDGRIEENRFKSEKREYPVDFATPFDVFYILKLKVPPSYKIEELPQQKMLTLPNGSGRFLYNVTVNGNEVNFSSQLTISKSMIVPQDYPALREFYTQVMAKQAEQIVLKKN